jgi:DNA-binding FadR family transcriptional regulator
MKKLMSAREALEEEVGGLAAKRAGQEARLAKLQAAKTQLRENAERLSEKYEDIKVRWLKQTRI